MARYALGFEAKRQSPELSAPRGASWPVSFLIKSLVWFQHVRFAFAALFALFGVSGLLWQEYFEGVGLHVDPVWSLWTASVVCGLNLFFLYLTHRVRASDSAVFARGALWAQILADIVVLTVAVHFFGCTDSFVSFAYLFHIVLSSIFFSRMRSFFVTILACTLFVGCVAAEKFEAIVTRSVFIHGAIRNGDSMSIQALSLHVGSALAVWLIVWHLTSRLSVTVRRRDIELDRTNHRLIAASRERATHMLRTTHELKAPFAAIHANAQLLQKGYCGELPAAAQDIVERIEQRCTKLSEEIKQMLQLANLDSAAQEDPDIASIDLPQCLSQCMDHAKDMAGHREVNLVTSLEPVTVYSVHDHVRMIFENLISNAIAYSHQGGSVFVKCGLNGEKHVEVSVRDEGIGIPEPKLHKIFDDYYRAQEAVDHNKSSTGLGLAVVRRIALKRDLQITVESELGRGTMFRVVFPQRKTAEAAE